MLLLPLTLYHITVSPAIGKNHAQSHGSGQSSWHDLDIKLSDKSNLHGLGRFFPTPPFGKRQLWPAASHALRRTAIIAFTHLGKRTAFCSADDSTRCDGSASLWAPVSEVFSATYLACKSGAAFSKGPWGQQLLVWVTLGLIIHLCSQIKSWLGQLYPIIYSLWTMAAAEHIFKKSSPKYEKKIFFLRNKMDWTQLLNFILSLSGF